MGRWDTKSDFLSTCCIVDTSSFLKKLLPVEERLIEEILGRVKAQGYYLDGWWKDFPDAENLDHQEDAVLVAFVGVSNLIRKTVEEVIKSEGDSHPDRLGANEWVDYRSRPPISEDKDDIGPNALLVLKEPNVGMKEQKTKETVSTLTAWWLPVVAVVKMKRFDDDLWDDLLPQLIDDLQSILRRQLDRRFAFGFALGPSHLAILMHDRSGVLATELSIDIHKEPENFIRLIAAFVVLPAKKLGFDPNMEVYDKSTGIAMPSYKLNNAIVPHSLYNRQWVIRLNDGTKYLTVKALRIPRAGILHSTGSVVWVVVPHGISSKTRRSSQGSLSASNSPQDELPVFVLKQSWRESAWNCEGYYYNFAKGSETNFIGAILSCEDAMIEGEKDETSQSIRQGLDIPPAIAEERKRDREYFRTFEMTTGFVVPPQLSPSPSLEINTHQGGIRGLSIKDPGEVVSRIRTRLLSSTYGWPLRHFSTLGELLRVLQGAIQGHKYLYENGVLHRDISPGNIIIEWQPGSELSTVSSRGCLIDLDRARVGEKIEGVLLPKAENGWNLFAEEIQCFLNRLTQAVMTLPAVPKFQVQEEIIVRAFELPLDADSFKYSLVAVRHALKFGHLPRDGTLTCKTLKWEQAKKCFNYHTYPENEPLKATNGTPPYISGEILDRHYFTRLKDSEWHVYHDAVHDIESFFWVLVEMCLTLKGPGERRDEFALDPAGDPEDIPEPGGDRTKHLRTVVWHLFNSDFGRLYKYKGRLFPDAELFETDVLQNFHPTFHLLKPLISEWFSLLQIAYRFRSYEYHNIHDRVIAIFDKALKFGDAQLDVLDEAGTQALRARQEDIEHIIGV